jgi:hypothetical protein
MHLRRPPWWGARVWLQLPVWHASCASLPDDGPSNGASMWVAPKCRAKAMPVVCASNGDTEALLWCCRRGTPGENLNPFSGWAATVLVRRVLPRGVLLEASSMFGWLQVGAVILFEFRWCCLSLYCYCLLFHWCFFGPGR